MTQKKTLFDYAQSFWNGLLCTIFVILFGTNVNAGNDPRIELATYYAIVECMGHINNDDAFYSFLPIRYGGDIIDRQTAPPKGIMIGPHQVFIEMYFGTSNIGFKSYVNLKTKKVNIAAYGMHCKELNWKGIDEMMKEANDWDFGKNSDSLALRVLDFILPKTYHIKLCRDSLPVEFSRKFGDQVLESSLGDPCKCKEKSCIQIHYPKFIFREGDHLFYSVYWKSKGKRNHLRYFSTLTNQLALQNPIAYAGSYLGRPVLFDFKK